MDAATISTRTLEIDGMSGDTCVQKVTGALKNVFGVSTQSVKVGSATIGADQNGANAACKAINSAGFKAHEDASAGQTSGSACSVTKSLAGDSACSSQGAKASSDNAAPKPVAAGV